MQTSDIYEPYKLRHAVYAASLLFAVGGFFALSGGGGGGTPPPIEIVLLPAPAVAESKPAPAPKPQPPKEAPKLADVVRAEEEEKKRKEEEEQRRLEEEQRKRDEQKQREEEAELKRKKDAEEKRKEEEEQKRKDEEARKKKEREEERKKKEREEAEKERQRKEEEARAAKQAAADASRRLALSKRVGRLGNKIMGDTIKKIERHLDHPIGVPKDSEIVTVLEVRLTKEGALKGLPYVIESSGYPEYDDAAVGAVLQSAPLPVPPKSDRFIWDDEEFSSQFLTHTLYIRPR